MARIQYSDLILVGFLTILTVVFTETPGLIFLMMVFLPGYSLMAAVFPGKTDIKGFERGVLSVALSLAVTALTGLVLKYTSLGMHLTQAVLGVSGFTMVMVVAAFIRRWKAGEEESFSLSPYIKSVKTHFKDKSMEYKVVSIIMVISMILAVSATVYIAVTPHQGDGFTEFYILGENGTAAYYPSNLTVGEESNLTIGIVNHEYETVDYLLVVKSDNRTLTKRNVTLEKGAKLEIPYNFTAGSAGRKEMQFILYRLPDEVTVYRSLHIWVEVE